MRARHARVTSTGETSRAAMARESFAIVQSVNVLTRVAGVGIVLERHDEARRLVGEGELRREARDGGGEIHDGSWSTIWVAHTLMRFDDSIGP